VRETIKNLLAAMLYHFGILRWLIAVKLRNRAVVLMYHRVLPKKARDDSFSAAAIVVEPTVFDAHLQTLKRYLRPLAPQEFFERLTGAQPGFSRHCLVTFDDGWHDNHAHALPILEHRQVPALVYVATGYIDTRHCFWQERLARMLHTLWRQQTSQPSLFAEVGVPKLLEQSAESVKVYVRSAITAVKHRSRDELVVLLGKAEAALRANGIATDETGEDRFMTWGEVSQLSASKVVTIGSHAHTHTPMTKLSAAEIAQELSESRCIIERQLGAAPLWFAYPNGDHHDVSHQAVAAAGYRMAVTTETGLVAAGDDPMQVRRINIHDQAAPTPARLLCRIAGLF
jgi:peptidoglycan/xylan/chitin deacetylase (PgdA/CDA1 family)